MTPRTRAELALLSITIIWGSTFATTKMLLSEIHPFTYVSLRFGLASILFALLFWSRIKNGGWKPVAGGMVLGLLLFTGFSLQTVGLLYTTASKSAFITGLLVIMTPILQIVIERKPPRAGNIVGIAVVTVGLYLLTSPEGSELNKGDLLTLGCAFCFALYVVLLDVFSKDLRPEGLTLVQFVVCALAGLVVAIGTEPLEIHLNIHFVAGILYLIIFATIVAIYVQTRFQKDTTPTRAAVIFSAEPVVAAVIAFFALNEVIGLQGVVGGGLIVAGVLISELT
jgi:drug/metabolite transporter (DMT)-like permease